MNLFTGAIIAFALYTGILCFVQTRNQPVSRWMIGRIQNACPYAENDTFCLNGGKSRAEKIYRQTVCYCECPPGFFGERCELRRKSGDCISCGQEVADHFCLNGGTCVEDKVGDLSTYYCACTTDYWKEKCQTRSLPEMLPCPPDKDKTFCWNGGTCYSQCFGDDEHYFCECPSDYTGLRCQHETLPEQACGPPYYFLLCLNGGTCSRLLWHFEIVYSCHCTEGYYGVRCENEAKNAGHDKCQSEWFCLNGGSCYAVVSEDDSIYFCKCEDGFTGQRCELKLQRYGEPCSSSIQEIFCRNGGTCYEGNIREDIFYYCQCRVGFWGARCEEQTITRLQCPETLKINLCHNGGTCLAITSNGQDRLYFCKCAEGFSGIACEYSDKTTSSVGLSVCPLLAQELCLNGGTCYFDRISEETGDITVYYCDCPYPYHGERCELKFPTVNKCPQFGDANVSLCSGRGVCIEITLKDFVIYYCDCEQGFYGIRCEHSYLLAVAIRDCRPPLDSMLCLNGGTCIQMISEEEFHTLHFCKCVAGFFGLSCEYPYPPEYKTVCPPVLRDTYCLNGGTCYMMVVRGFPSYYCACPIHFLGDKCEIKNVVKPDFQESGSQCPYNIAKSYCLNGGSCYMEYSTVGQPAYYCVCVSPYYGERCQERFHRRSVPEPTDINGTCSPLLATMKCQNGGTCVTNVSNGKTVFYCVCPAPFYGDKCEFSNLISKYHTKRSTKYPCPSEMSEYCLNGGSCYMTDSLEGHVPKCQCLIGYFGERCQFQYHKHNAKLPCPGDLATNFCQNGGTCYMEFGSGVTPVFHCFCTPPYIGKRCEQILYNHHSYQCPSDFCQNGGTCVALDFTTETIYHCNCPYPFYGKTCQLTYTESVQCPPGFEVALCKNDGLCVRVESNGHYIHWCQCRNDYYGARCEHAQPITYNCRPPFNLHLCKNGGSCVSYTVNEQKLFFCKCTEGFTGPSCEYLLPRALLPDVCPPAMKATFCLNGGKCQAVLFMDDLTYFCKCSYPYHGDRCELKFSAVSPCLQDIASCLCCNNGECSKITLDNCDIFYCRCPPYYYGARCEHYQQMQNDCPYPFSTELCKNGGTCVPVTTKKQKNIYFCKCVEGFYGMSCEYPYPALQLTCVNCPPYVTRSLCVNGGVCCMDVIAGVPFYYCVCPEPYYGEKCELQRLQELSCPVPFRLHFCLNDGVCVQEKSNGYNIHRCKCAKGYYGARCEHRIKSPNNTVECPLELKEDLCQNGGKCVGLLVMDKDLFFCACPDRFYGIYCENIQNIHTDVSSALECPHHEMAPYCLHGGTCYFDAFLSLYYCICYYPYTGQRCEYTLPVQSSCSEIFGKYLCLNGGTCIYIRLIHYGIYFCKCPEGFSGSKCEYSYEDTGTLKCPSPLDTILCKNGGTCYGVTLSVTTQPVRQHVLYFCMCLENFYGLSCEYQHIHQENIGQACPPEIEHHFCENGGTCYAVKIEGIDVFYCECLNPYSGARCELIDPKLQSCPWILHQFLCLNGGHCTLFENTHQCGVYYCECKEGYSGHRCEKKMVPEIEAEYCNETASEWFCLNDGICFQEVIDGQNIYHCDCKKNFFGARCQIEVFEQKNCSIQFTDLLCLHGGTCVQIAIGIIPLFFCECQDGFIGLRCEFKQPRVRDCCQEPIDKLLCLNGGSCFKENIEQEDYFMCVCQGHYFGPRCEYKPAKPDETCFLGSDEIFCMNGGTCYSFMFESATVYYCECPDGHYGGRCEYAANNTLIEGLCSADIADGFCLNGGTCYHIQVLNDLFYYCECKSQYTGVRCEIFFAPDTILCSENITEVFCRRGSSKCYEVTIDIVTLYFCVCDEGYSGLRCQYEKSKLICPKKLETEFCLNGGICRAIHFKGYTVYYCECTTEYYGLRCDNRFDSSETVAYPCEQTVGENYCLNGGTCYETDHADEKVNFCECPEGYNGLRCDYLDAQFESQVGVGVSGKESNCYPPHNETFCFNGGTCYQDVPGQDANHWCICPTNYFGPRCESTTTLLAFMCPEDIASDFCLNGGTCYQVDHGPDTLYFCHCPEEFTGLRCENLIAVGFKGSETQLCAPPLNENYCQNGGTCYHVVNGTNSFYICECPGEFTGPRCEKGPQKSQECDFPLDVAFCFNSGTCHQVVIPGKTVYFCECTADFYGLRCESHMPCAGPLIKRCDTEKEKDFCLNGGLCYESECRDKTVYACTCPEGYTGVRCELPPARRLGCPYPIDAYYCLHRGQCITIEFEGHAMYGCHCPPGYSGERCQFYITSMHGFCPLQFGEIFCLHGGICFQIEVLNETVYYCECPEGYWGERCQFSGIFKFSCPKPLNSVLCQNDGKCYMVIWAGNDIYYCQCPAGYTGTRCDKEVNLGSLICLSKACQNGGTCYTKMAGGEITYVCECPGGSWGEKCENSYSAIDSREILSNYSNMQFVLSNSCCPMLQHRAYLPKFLFWMFLFLRFLVEITDC